MPTHYEISSAIHPGKQLTPAQRTSSLFSEAPRIGTTILRRGKILKLSEAELHIQSLQIKRHLASGSIEIYQVDEETGARARIITFGAPSIQKAVQEHIEKQPIRDDVMLQMEAEKAIEETGEAPDPVDAAPVAAEAQEPEEAPAVEPAPEVVQEEVQADTVAEAPKSRKRR